MKLKKPLMYHIAPFPVAVYFLRTRAFLETQGILASPDFLEMMLRSEAKGISEIKVRVLNRY
jgi:hypothetical protein